jgi:cytochrome c556
MSHRHRLVAAGLIFALTGGAAAQEHGPMSSPPDGDTRRPLPLTAMMAAHQKANMREHLAAIERIVGAVARDDMPGVEKAAAAIGLSESMGRMCEHLGAAAPGFTPMALQFHRTADGIAVAARGGDRKAVLTALDTTLQACVGCHAAYRQEIVDEATWQHLAAEAGATQGTASDHDH